MEGGEGLWLWQWQEIIRKEMVLAVAAIVVSLMVMKIWKKLWLEPQRIRSLLKKQGISGPKPSFPLGNIPEIKRIQSHSSNNISSSSHQPDEQWFPSLFPFLQHWRKLYGKNHCIFLVISFFFDNFVFGHLYHMHIFKQ